MVKIALQFMEINAYQSVVQVILQYMETIKTFGKKGIKVLKEIPNKAWFA